MGNQNNNLYDLEERTFLFAKDIRTHVKTLVKTIANNEDSKQLIRSSGSVGANYIEANESLGKKDFLMRIRISRKEAKESRYWLKLLEVPQNDISMQKHEELIQEATELMLIFGSILRKTEVKNKETEISEKHL